MFLISLSLLLNFFLVFQYHSNHFAHYSVLKWERNQQQKQKTSKPFMWVIIGVLTQKLCCLGDCCGLWYQEGWLWLLWSTHHTETAPHLRLWTRAEEMNRNMAFILQNFKQLQHMSRKDISSLSIKQTARFITFYFALSVNSDGRQSFQKCKIQ